MQNPFRYGAIATGNYFADRVVELTELEADIRNGHNVVIISPRRYGKTSLVFRALEHLKQERILFAYLDLFRTPTKDRFADRLADSIYSGLVAPFERARHRALEIFRSLPTQPTVTINPDGTPSFQFGAAQHARDVDRTIESLLTLPGMIAAQRGRRIAVILDEFQEVVAIDPHLPALMRAVFQLQGGVAHVFMGSRRHLSSASSPTRTSRCIDSPSRCRCVPSTSTTLRRSSERDSPLPGSRLPTTPSIGSWRSPRATRTTRRSCVTSPGRSLRQRVALQRRGWLIEPSTRS